MAGMLSDVWCSRDRRGDCRVVVGAVLGCRVSCVLKHWVELEVMVLIAYALDLFLFGTIRRLVEIRAQPIGEVGGLECRNCRAEYMCLLRALGTLREPDE